MSIRARVPVNDIQFVQLVRQLCRDHRLTNWLINLVHFFLSLQIERDPRRNNFLWRHTHFALAHVKRVLACAWKMQHVRRSVPALRPFEIVGISFLFYVALRCWWLCSVAIWNSTTDSTPFHSISTHENRKFMAKNSINFRQTINMYESDSEEVHIGCALLLSLSLVWGLSNYDSYGPAVDDGRMERERERKQFKFKEINWMACCVSAVDCNANMRSQRGWINASNWLWNALVQWQSKSYLRVRLHIASTLTLTPSQVPSAVYSTNRLPRQDMSSRANECCENVKRIIFDVIIAIVLDDGDDSSSSTT